MLDSRYGQPGDTVDGGGEWVETTSEKFWSEAENNEHIADRIRGVVNTIDSHMGNGATLLYGISPRTGLKGVYIWFQNSKKVPFYINSSGEMRFYCKCKTVWHSIHRSLLRQLQSRRLLNQMPAKEKEWFGVRVYKHSSADINELCRLYAGAIKEVM